MTWNNYHASFIGRTKGAIGVTHHCSQDVIAPDLQAAMLALYATHQDISGAVFTLYRPALKTGVQAVFNYGGKFVPCIVLAVRDSYPMERFKHHKTVRLLADAFDLTAGDVLTSQAGHVFPLECMTPNADHGFSDFDIIIDPV